MYLYRAIDNNGATVAFWCSKEPDLRAAKRLIHKALTHHGRSDRITINSRQTNRSVVMQCYAEDRLKRGGKPIAVRSSKGTNNNIEQDHRRIKRRVRSMPGLKSAVSTIITLAGIELVHVMRNSKMYSSQ